MSCQLIEPHPKYQHARRLICLLCIKRLTSQHISDVSWEALGYINNRTHRTWGEVRRWINSDNRAVDSVQNLTGGNNTFLQVMQTFGLIYSQGMPLHNPKSWRPNRATATPLHLLFGKSQWNSSKDNEVLWTSWSQTVSSFVGLESQVEPRQ